MTDATDPKHQATGQDQERGLIDSFPASDPNSATPTLGPRAMPIASAGTAKPVADQTTLSRHFADAEGAKLALESLVRGVPLDRDATTLDGNTLVIKVPGADAARIEALLLKA